MKSMGQKQKTNNWVVRVQVVLGERIQNCIKI